MTPSKPFRQSLTNRPEFTAQLKLDFSVKTSAKAWPMHRAFRSTASWSLYGLGHVVSIPMLRWDLAFLYSLYRALMLASAHIQGESEQGPWGPVVDPTP